jgi:hypothetical protein
VRLVQGLQRLGCISVEVIRACSHGLTASQRNRERCGGGKHNLYYIASYLDIVHMEVHWLIGSVAIQLPTAPWADMANVPSLHF